MPVLAGAAVPPNDTSLQEFASKVRFEPLARADGISLGTVVQIFQDHRGFLWFGTTNGLNRYDGYQTVLYTDVPMDRSGPISYPGLLYESRDGSLWVGTQVLSLYRPGMGAVNRFVPPPRTPASSWPQKISAIHEDDRGFLWLGVSDFRLSHEISEPVLYQFYPKTGTSSAFRIPSEITHGQPGSIRAIEHDKSGTLWLGTAYGLIRFDPTAGTFTAYPHTHPRRVYSTAVEFAFNNLIWDRDGKLWVHMPAGLERFDPESGSFDRFREAYFWFMFSDAGGFLWLCGGDSGAKLFDPQSGALAPVYSDDDESEPDLIDAALPDQAGNVWAYFSRKGLQRYTAAFTRFGKVASGRGDQASLPVGKVAKFSEDRAGKMWISVSGFGLLRFDPATRIFTRFPYKPGTRGGLPGSFIESMYEDRAGTFWIGTTQEFGRLDRQSGIYTHSGALPNNWVTSMFEDRTSRFWVGNMLGPMHLFNRQTGAFTSADVNGGYVTHEDRSGILWFGYPPGLNRLDAAGKVRSISLLDRPDGTGPENVMVQTLYEDAEGIFWLATQSGLFRFDPQSEKSIRYGIQEGLADIDIRCALGDGQGNLWLSTASGLSRFDLQEKRFYNYDERDGLQGNTFQGRSCYQTRDGKMYFGGKNGFNAFYPRDVVAPWPEPPVVLTDLSVSGRGAATSSIPNLDGNAVQLSPAQDGFTIGFAALSYGNPARTRYRFKLENHEARWVEADSEHRFARYTSVPPGRYVFRVQASIDGQAWEHEASLHLTLAPPWWNTPWSKAAALLALGALIFGAHQSRVKVLERRERRLESLVERRTAELMEARDQAQAANQAKGAFLAHMSHELRNPLSSILGISNLLRETGASEEQCGYLDLIDHSSDHLLALIDDVLDVAKIEAGKHEVIAAPCDLAALAHEVTEIIRVKAESKKLSLVSLPAPGLDPYVLTDAPKLRQVLINLLSNAIKFTDSGAVVLRVSTIGKDDAGRLKIRFEVEDTGVGIAPGEQARIFEPFVQVGRPGGQKGTGLGLTITRQFVEMMGGSIALESVVGRGSRFTVEVPSEVAAESEVVATPSTVDSRFVLEPGQPECRVLIVEDDPENGMILEQMLRRAGFSVRLARSGAAGIDEFREWRPHFIWMDMRMPEMSGADAARRIRELPGGRKVKIAAVTASAFASEREEVLAAGMDDFVRKPYRWDKIFDCMMRQLGLRFRHPAKSTRAQ